MPGTLINEQMKAAIGTEMRRRVSFPVDPSDIRRWAVAVYYPEPPPAYFWDEDAAAATRHKGIVAPEEFNPFAWMTASDTSPTGEQPESHDANGIEKRLGITSPGLSYRLNGGVDVEYGVRMRPGDVITAVFRLAGYTERIGRLGPMLFTVVEDTWTNQHGELVKRNRSTLIRYK